MSDPKTGLIDLLDRVHQDMLAALESASYDRVVYPASGWRVKDILGHVTFWEEEAAHSLRAFARGESYCLEDFTNDETCNAQEVERRKDYSVEQFRAEWIAARDNLRSALAALPPDRLDGQIMCPWKQHSTVERLIIDIANHERDHAAEIRGAA